MTENDGTTGSRAYQTVGASGQVAADNRRGLIWMVGDMTLITVSLVAVKLLGRSYASIQLVFLRSLIGLAVMSPWIVSVGWAGLRTRRPGLHLLRVTCSTIALTASFYAVTSMPLAEVIAINYTRPLMLTLLAWLVLSELVSRRRWLFTAMGFAGLLVMLWPDLLAVSDGGPRPAMLILLGGAFAGVCAVIVQKILAQSDGEPVLMVYYSVAITVISAIPAGFVWRTPMLEDLPLIGLIGLTAIAGQFCFLRAYKLAQASFLAPISYFQMVIGAAMGFIIFQEVPTWWTIGGAVVIAFCVIVGGREGQARLSASRIAKPGTD